MGAGRNITYHYFVGMGARSVGNDVHSFDTEEQTFQVSANTSHLRPRAAWWNPTLP